MHRLIRPQLQDVPLCPHGSVLESELEKLGATRHVIDFSVNTNPLGPPPGVAKALATVDFSRYPDPDARPLRAALADRLRVDAHSLLMGNGSAELIWLIALAFLEPDDRVLIVGPTFGEYERACKIMGAQVVQYHARMDQSFRPEPGKIRQLISRLQPKLVFLCNPNNPTGVLLPSDCIDATLGNSEALTIIDEAYATFAPEKADFPRPSPSAGRILLRSLTKDYALTGLRLGYVVAEPETIEALETVRPPWSVNGMAQAAGLACLGDPEHLRRSLEAIETAKRYLYTALGALGLHPLGSAANFFLLEVGDAPGFRRQLLEHGCCVRDCTSFGLPQFVRIGVRTLPECQTLVEVIANVLGTQPGRTAS